MKNFSRFGFASQEWLAHEAEHGFPPMPPIGQVAPEVIQEFTNRAREVVSGERMKSEGLYEKVDIQTIQIPTRDGLSMPIRVYRPILSPKNKRHPIYIYYHGGGFLYGTLSTEDAACALIVTAMSIVVVSVCYRHTPQVKYPTPFLDAFDSFNWVMENMHAIGGDIDNVIVGGVSAGAGLAASVVLREYRKLGGTNHGRIKGQLLCIPWLFVDKRKLPKELLALGDQGSRYQCADAPLLPQHVLKFFEDNLQLKSYNGDDEVEPISMDGKCLSSMPKIALIAAGMDPLRDDGLLYAQKASQEGVPTKVHIFPGLPHGFRRFQDLASCRRWDEIIVESLQWVLRDKTSEGEGSFHINVEES